jgi:hypothetical protein
VRGVSTPIIIFSGDRDPVRKLYIDPLLKVRDAWKVVTVPHAGHMTCFAKDEFKQGLADWIDSNKEETR